MHRVGEVRDRGARGAAPPSSRPSPARRTASAGCASPTGTQYTNALRKAALARKAAEARGGRAGARRGADQEAQAKRGPRRSRRRRARRATPDSAGRHQPTLGPRAPARGPSPFGRVVGHGRAHRATWANVGAHGRTSADPRSATGTEFAKPGRAHTVARRSQRASASPYGLPRPHGRTPAAGRQERATAHRFTPESSTRPGAAVHTLAVLRPRDHARPAAQLPPHDVLSGRGLPSQRRASRSPRFRECR